MADKEQKSHTRLWRALIVPGCLLALVLAPIWLPISYAVLIWRDYRFRQRVISAGRFIDWTDLLPRLEQGLGTLIFEQAQKQGCRVWWTEQDILSFAQVHPPAERELDYLLLAEPHPFVKWCYATFLDVATGSALLTVPPYRYPPGFVRASFFRERFPLLSVVMTVKMTASATASSSSR